MSDAFRPGDLPFASHVPVPVQQAYGQAQVLCAAADIATAVDQLAVRTTLAYQDRSPLLIVLLPDAAVFAGMLQRRVVAPWRALYLMPNGDDFVCSGALAAPAEQPALLLVGDGRGALALRGRDWLLAHDVKALSTIALVSDASLRWHDQAWLVSDTTEAVIGTGLAYLDYGTNLPGLYTLPGIAVAQ